MSLSRRLDKVAEAIENAEDAEKLCIVIRFVAPGDPLDDDPQRVVPKPDYSGRAPGMYFQRYDRSKGEWVECSLNDADDRPCRPSPPPPRPGN